MEVCKINCPSGGMVDTPDLGSGAVRRVSSSLTLDTMKKGGSKIKIGNKLSKKVDSILDLDNRKATPSMVRRIMSASDQEREYESDNCKK